MMRMFKVVFVLSKLLLPNILMKASDLYSFVTQRMLRVSVSFNANSVALNNMLNAKFQWKNPVIQWLGLQSFNPSLSLSS